MIKEQYDEDYTGDGKIFYKSTSDTYSCINLAVSSINYGQELNFYNYEENKLAVENIEKYLEQIGAVFLFNRVQKRINEKNLDVFYYDSIL